MGCRGLDAFHYSLPSLLNYLWLPGLVLSKRFHPRHGLQEAGCLLLPSFQLDKSRWAIDLEERWLYSRICVVVPLYSHPTAPCIPWGPPWHQGRGQTGGKC